MGSPLRPLPARGPHLQDVVSVGVTEVPCADLGAHVPAAERGRGKLQPPDFQQHVAHGREGVPAQAQGRKPLQPGGVGVWGSGRLGSLACLASRPPSPWGRPLLHLTQSPPCSRGVLQGHLKDQLGGQDEEFWGLIWGLEQQRQHVKAAVSGGPTMLGAELRGAGPEQGLRGPNPRPPQGAPSLPSPSVVSARVPLPRPPLDWTPCLPAEPSPAGLHLPSLLHPPQ